MKGRARTSPLRAKTEAGHHGPSGMRLLFCFLWALLTTPLLARPLDAIVLVDESGSMYGNSRLPASDPTFHRYTAVQCLARKLKPGDRLMVIPFGTTALWEGRVPWSDPFDARGLDWGPLKRTGEKGAAAQYSTNYADALEKALQTFAAKDPLRSRVVILLSDGTPNAAGNELSTLELKCADLLDKAGARLYALGLGEEVQEGTLALLTDHANGRAMVVEKASQLPFAMTEIIREAAGREVRTPPDRRRFIVGPKAKELRALAAAGEDAAFSLISPRGERVVPVTEDAVLPERQSDRVHWLRLSDPEPGEWTLDGDPSAVDIGYESSFAARMTVPEEGELIPQDSAVGVIVEAAGAEVSDQLRGTLALSAQDGFSREADLRFDGTRGRAELSLAGASIGGAQLKVRVWRKVAGGEEEGIPTSCSIIVVEAPPGKPVVELQWPKSNRFALKTESLLRIPLKAKATKEAKGGVLKFSVAKNWRFVGASEVRITGGSQEIILTLDGPYAKDRGRFESVIEASSADPETQVQNQSFPVIVEAKTWWDNLKYLLFGAVPFLLPIILAALFIVIGALYLRAVLRLRREALDSIDLEFDLVLGAKREVRNAQGLEKGKGRNAKSRTFGGSRADRTMDLGDKYDSVLVTASIAGREVMPSTLDFTAADLRNAAGQSVGRVKVQSGEAAAFSIPLPDGRRSNVKASYTFNRAEARTVKTLRAAFSIVAVLLAVLVIYTLVNLMLGFDRQSYRSASLTHVRLL